MKRSSSEYHKKQHQWKNIFETLSRKNKTKNKLFHKPKSMTDKRIESTGLIYKMHCDAKTTKQEIVKESKLVK